MELVEATWHQPPLSQSVFCLWGIFFFLLLSQAVTVQYLARPELEVLTAPQALWIWIFVHELR
jgi:hypothetical protein